MAENFIDNPDFVGLSGAGDASGTDQLNLSDLQANLPSVELPPMSQGLQNYLTQNQIGNYGNQSPYSFNIDNAVNPNDQLTNLIKDINVNGLNVSTDPFAAGKRMMFDGKNPNIQNQFYDRYASHSDFEELGFSPFRDNEALYNEHSSWFEEMGRAAGQFGVLASLGFKDAVGFGDRTDPGMARQFEEAMNIGSSSKGGIGGFTTNLFLNSGYTVGILGELAVEELGMLAGEALLGISTAASGGTATPLTAPAMAGIAATMAARATKAFNKITDAWKMASNLTKTLDNLQDVNKAREYFTKAAKATGNFLNPAENTVDFFRNIDKFDHLKNWQKTAKGFGEFYKDVRNVRLAWGESALEGGMVQNQMERDLLSEFQDTHGRMPNDAEAMEIKTLAKTAGLTTSTINAPLILLSNKLTFDGLVRGGMRRTGLNFAEALTSKSGGKIIFNPKKAAGETYKAVAKGFKGTTELYLKNPSLLVTKGLNYTKANLAEGFQELGQETVASASEGYYKALYSGDATRGAYYNYVLENLGGGHGVGVAAETFLSGFLMGGMIAPVSNTVAAAARGAQGFEGSLAGRVGGLINEAGLYVKDIGRGTLKGVREGKSAKETYMQQASAERAKRKKTALDKKLENEKSLEADVKLLNEMYKDPRKYLSPNMENLLSQKEFRRLMNLAEKNNDTRTFYDAKDSSIIKNALTALHYGQMDNMLNRIDGMKKLSKEDILSDPTVQMSYEDYQKELLSTEAFVKQINSSWTTAIKKFPNPFDPNKYKQNHPLYETEVQQYMAWNQAVQEFVFNQASFARTLARRGSILRDAQNVSGLKNASYADFKNIYDFRDAELEFKTLAAEISSLKAIEQPSADVKTKLKESQEKFDLLKALWDDINYIEKNLDVGEKLPEDAYAKIEKSFTNYMNHIAKKSGDYKNVDSFKQALEGLIDYHILGNRANAQNSHVNTLLDPRNFTQVFSRKATLMKDLFDAKADEIRTSLEEYKKIKGTNDMLNELYDNGIFIDPKDVVALEKEGKIPKNFYTIENDKWSELDIRSDQYKKAIEIIEKHLSEKDIEIFDIDLNQLHKQRDPYHPKSRNKFDNDKRRYKDYAQQFGFDPEASSSKVPLKRVLEAIINSKDADGNPYVTEREIALATELLKITTDEEFVTFSNNEKSPGYYTVSGGVVIDARWSSHEYKQGRVGHPLEHVILHEEIHRRTVEHLNDDSEFSSEITTLFQTSIKAWNSLTDDAKLQFVKHPSQIPYGLYDINEFVAEAMSNENFQNFLSTIKADAKQNVSVWKAFVDLVLENVKKFLTKRPSGTVLNAVLELVTAKINIAYGEVSEEAPVDVRTALGKVTRETPINEIPSDLQTSLVQLFRELQEQRKGDRQPYLRGFETMSNEDILKSEQFLQFFKGPYTKKISLVEEYNNKIAKQPKPNKPETFTTAATFTPTTPYGTTTGPEMTTASTGKDTEAKKTDKEFKKEIIKGDSYHSRLQALGYPKTERDIMTLPEANSILRQNLTKEERDAQLRAKAQAIDPDVEKKRVEYLNMFNGEINAIETYEDYKASEESIIALFTSLPDFEEITGLTAEDMEKKLKERLKEIAFTIKFADIVVGETLMANDKNLSRLEVIGKGAEHITVTDKVTRNTFEIKEADIQNRIKYRYSKALMESELETTRQATEEEKALMQETTEQAIGNENINEDLDKAKKSSKDDLANDLLNNICK